MEIRLLVDARPLSPGFPTIAPPCAKLPALYRPRDPQISDLWCLIDKHFDSFQQVYDEQFQAKYGFWRPVIERSAAAFLKCGDRSSPMGEDILSFNPSLPRL